MKISPQTPKLILILSILFFLSLLTIFALSKGKPSILTLLSSNDSSNYVGSLYKGNYIWGGAMNLAWSDLSQNIIKDKILLSSQDPLVQTMVSKFNAPVVSTIDLDEPSYYIKSGYGQGTVDAINRESRAKFPSKSFSDLDLKLASEDIIAYAYFLKQVEYLTAFSKQNLNFQAKPVKGFYAKNDGERNNINVLSYNGDDKFIISLRLKDSSDQLILAKGYDMSSPKDVVDALRQSQFNQGYFGNNDIFQAPKLSLSAYREYKELMGKFLLNQGFQKYLISAMYENIKFDMDEKGARVENEAVIGMVNTSMPNNKPQIRRFVLDQPYWVIMKRTSSSNPYFLLGVTNTELMTSALSP